MSTTAEVADASAAPSTAPTRGRRPRRKIAEVDGGEGGDSVMDEATTAPAATAIKKAAANKERNRAKDVKTKVVKNEGKRKVAKDVVDGVIGATEDEGSSAAKEDGGVTGKRKMTSTREKRKTKSERAGLSDGMGEQEQVFSTATAEDLESNSKSASKGKSKSLLKAEGKVKLDSALKSPILEAVAATRRRAQQGNEEESFTMTKSQEKPAIEENPISYVWPVDESPLTTETTAKSTKTTSSHEPGVSTSFPITSGEDDDPPPSQSVSSQHMTISALSALSASKPLLSPSQPTMSLLPNVPTSSNTAKSPSQPSATPSSRSKSPPTSSPSIKPRPSVLPPSPYTSAAPISAPPAARARNPALPSPPSQSLPSPPKQPLDIRKTPSYRSLLWRWTSGIVGASIFIATSLELYNRYSNTIHKTVVERRKTAPLPSGIPGLDRPKDDPTARTESGNNSGRGSGGARPRIVPGSEMLPSSTSQSERDGEDQQRKGGSSVNGMLEMKRQRGGYGRREKRLLDDE